MTNDLLRLLYFARKQINSRYKIISVLVILLTLLSLLPLYNYEILQNKAILIVYSSNDSITETQIAELQTIPEINFITTVRHEILNGVHIVDVNNNFVRFAKKSLYSGDFPQDETSLLAVSTNETNYTLGEYIELNNTQYKIVGLLTPTTELKIMLGISSLYDTFVRFTNPKNGVSELAISFMPFTNISMLCDKIRDVLGKNIGIYTPTITSIEVVQTEIYFLNALTGWCATAALIVFILRKNYVIMFSIGWIRKYIVAEAILTFLVITATSYVLTLWTLYLLIDIYLNYFFFLSYFLLFPLFLILITIIVTYVFVQKYVVKRSVEVLTR